MPIREADPDAKGADIEQLGDRLPGLEILSDFDVEIPENPSKGSLDGRFAQAIFGFGEGGFGLEACGPGLSRCVLGLVQYRSTRHIDLGEPLSALQGCPGENALAFGSRDGGFGSVYRHFREQRFHSDQQLLLGDRVKFIGADFDDPSPCFGKNFDFPAGFQQADDRGARLKGDDLEAIGIHQRSLGRRRGKSFGIGCSGLKKHTPQQAGGCDPEEGQLQTDVSLLRVFGVRFVHARAVSSVGSIFRRGPSVATSCSTSHPSERLTPSAV